MSTKRVGILTSGGDCPGLNAAIRGVAKPLLQEEIELLGIRDGFRGLVEDKTMPLSDREISGLLVQGGTILGTSRYKPHKYPNKLGEQENRLKDALKTYKKHNLDALVILGGGGTQKNAYKLLQNGIKNIITLPKTIDNDVWGTDLSFGYDSGMAIACEAIDRLHTTASSHHRCMIVNTMGHNTGWLALGAGIAGGADVVLIPEIPFDPDLIIESLKKREKEGKRFSIIAIAEGATTRAEADKEGGEVDRKVLKKILKKRDYHLDEHISATIEKEVGIETRITTLGHLQRGGVPTPTDRVLATHLGTKAYECLMNGNFGNMIAIKNGKCTTIPLKDTVGKKKYIQMNDPLIKTANRIDVCLGQKIKES